MRNQADKLMDLGILYAVEFFYCIWIILSFSLTSGMFLENPVYERFKKIRYYLNVNGL